MTPDERAEKIVNICVLAWPKKPDINLIAAQIREAEKEAMGMRADPDCTEHCRLAKLEGRASMLEEAEKVVEQYFDAMNPDIQLAATDIIEHIRAIPLENK